MTLSLLLIYSTLLNILFSVNGLLLISTYSYIYISLNSYIIINYLNLDSSFLVSISSILYYIYSKLILIYYIYWLLFINSSYIIIISYYILVHHYLNTIIYISTFTIYNLCYLSFNSTVLNLSPNRLANIIFDNSLFFVLCLIFFINLTNLNIIFILYLYYISLLLFIILYLYQYIIMIVFLFVFVACLTGLIIDRYILLKFFLFYETFFFSISVIMSIYSVDINVMIIVFYLLSNSTFEVILGLSILLI